MKKLPIHPLAELAPRMTPAEYSALLADVRETRKIREPAVLYEGKILDGRHRQDAAFEAGVPLPLIDFKPAWGSPVRFVYSKLIHRNMGDSQKACVAVGLLDELEKEGTARKLANLKQGPRSGKISGSGPVNGESREQAGTLFGVSGRYIQEAKLVRKHDPGLFARVLSGQVTLPRAKREVRRSVKRAMLLERAKAAPAVGSWEIKTGDCVEGMGLLPSGYARLIFADPPYNIGVNYGRGAKADLIPSDQYLEFTREWTEECARVLKPDGSLWVLINDEWADHFGILLRSAGLRRRAWIKWYESFGVNCSDNFNRTSRHLFYCTKSETDFVFHREAFHRLSDRQTKYADKRAHPGGKLWDDVWGINPAIPRLVDNAAERVPDFPTQLPLALVRPIVLGASDPGDVVIDPFSGSGTTAEAAATAGRKFLGWEISNRFAELSRLRVRAALADVAAGKTKGRA